MSMKGGFPAAVAQLRGISQSPDADLHQMIEARDHVLPRYQALFAFEGIPSITEEDFRQFLQYNNNRHWKSLQRMGPAICADMDRLRNALRILLDQSRPIEDRLTELVPPKGPAYVPRLSKAVLTPILLITHPDQYGVWNQVSEAALKVLRIWPDREFDSTAPFGARYKQINEVLKDLASALGIDLWTLDGLFWRVGEPIDVIDDEGITTPPSAPPEPATVRFGLEKYLQEFLRDNWSRTELGESWKLHEEDGDPEAGYEYPCDIGRIDLLARHTTEPRWLVIELKRNQTSDQTVGQVMRYMGWVRKHLARPEDRVEGLIIAHEADASIGYALDVSKDIRLRLYEVNFRLKEPKS